MFRFFNWWGEPAPQERKFFQSIMGHCIYPYDEVHIHATMSTPDNRSSGIPLPKNSMSEKVFRIQYAGEGSYGHLDKFHLNIVPGDHPDTPQFIANPFMHLYMLRNEYPIDAFTGKRSYTGAKEKFCIFSVSNPAAKERIRCFKSLSNYKKVDSCGKVLNNMGLNCPGPLGSKEHRDFISQYKFSICFENGSMKNYMTEKLAIAYMSGTIPIYWGCANTADYINMDAIVYLKPNFTTQDLNALIDEVKALDSDEELYRKKFEQPLFKDGMVPDAFNIDALHSRVCACIQAIKENTAE